MSEQLIFQPWLDELRKANKLLEVPPIARAAPYSFVVEFEADYDADAFVSSIRLAPDAAGATEADFTVTVGTYSGGVTAVTFALDELETAGLVADDNGDGVVYMAFDILHTPSGGGEYLIAGGVIPVLGVVTA